MGEDSRIKSGASPVLVAFTDTGNRATEFAVDGIKTVRDHAYVHLSGH